MSVGITEWIPDGTEATTGLVPKLQVAPQDSAAATAANGDHNPVGAFMIGCRRGVKWSSRNSEAFFNEDVVAASTFTFKVVVSEEGSSLHLLPSLIRLRRRGDQVVSAVKLF